MRLLPAILVVLASALPANGQPTGRTLQVGVLFNAVDPADLEGPIPREPFARAFLESLRERGWTDGRNIRIHWRSAAQRYELRPGIIAELVRMPVDVLVLGGNYAIEEALRETRATPIVTVGVTGAVENKYVSSLSRPGGNLTGVSQDAGSGIHAKRLALLKQLAPRVSRVAFLIPAYARPEISLEAHRETLAAARELGISVFHQRFESVEGIEAAVDEAVRQGANGLFVTDAQPFSRRENQLHVQRAAQRHRLPAIYCYHGSAENGGLASYGDDIMGRYRRAAGYVDRILRGAHPSTLPIEQASKYEFVVNARAARAIALKVPASVLQQADRVVD